MRTILVIDDHVATLETICLILQRRGYITLPAVNADQAQEHFFGSWRSLRSGYWEEIVVSCSVPVARRKFGCSKVRRRSTYDVYYWR